MHNCCKRNLQNPTDPLNALNTVATFAGLPLSCSPTLTVRYLTDSELLEYNPVQTCVQQSAKEWNSLFDATAVLLITKCGEGHILQSKCIFYMVQLLNGSLNINKELKINIT